MIIYNLLTDGKKLTGVVDWEMSRWSDPEHDAARLLYYPECARSYYDQGRDENLEYDFLNKIFSKWIDEINEQSFQIKYNLYRSLFYLKALAWAVNSNSPDKNIKELERKWVKK